MTLVVVLVVLALVVAGAAAIAVANKRKFARDNQIAPGTATTAPAAWAGAHTPEAKLHRRLRDAVAAVRTNPALAEASMLEARVTLEQHALAVDERLVAVAALASPSKAEPLRAITEAVEAVERTVASLVDPTPDRAQLDAALAAVEERMKLIAEARAELTGEDPPRPQPS